MAKQVTKCCHWVSQSYLRSFAADPCKRKKIWRLGNDRGDPELKPIENVAVKFHLYAPIESDGLRDDTLEKKLAKLETWFGDPIWTEVCNGFPDFGSESLRKLTALLVAVTYLRNPRQLEWTQNSHRQIVNLMSEADPISDQLLINDKEIRMTPEIWAQIRDAGQEEVKASWNAVISGSAGMAEKLISLRWSVLFSKQPVFITSDNPVMFLHPSLDFKGLNDPETTVAFPLSPTRILMMDHRYGEPDSRYYALHHDPASMNVLIWRNALEHMFSSRHPDVVCAEMLADAERAKIV